MPFNPVFLQKKRDLTCYPPHALPQKVITKPILQGNMNLSGVETLFRLFLPLRLPVSTR